MFQRKLQALNHPTPNKVNLNDTQEYRSLVLWLEDQKIRHYKIEDRDGLRQINSNNWQKSYDKYLNALACPVAPNKPIEQFEWLLSFAVRLEYSDNVDQYNSVKCEIKKQTPKVVSDNPLDNLDFQSEDFVKGVNSLATILHITPHPDHLITLKAVAKVISKRLNSQALQNPDTVLIKGVPIPLEEAHLGFNSGGDYVYNQAAKILRLLYIQDLRKLQTCINETIVAAQSITANPKTDTKLGKVGK